MTMLISKFNKLIASKIVWLLFCLLVVFAFILMYIPQYLGSGTTAPPAGKIAGETIDAETFYSARNGAKIQHVIDNGRDAEEPGDLSQAAMKRVALMKKASDAGFPPNYGAVFNEVNQQYQANPEQMERQLQSYEQNFGVNRNDFLRFVAEDRALQSYSSTAVSSMLVSPYEMKKQAAKQNDSFQVSLAKVDRLITRDDIQVTDAEVQAYFDSNGSEYEIPEQVKIKYFLAKDEDALDTNLLVVADEDVYGFYTNLENSLMWVQTNQVEEIVTRVETQFITNIFTDVIVRTNTTPLVKAVDGVLTTNMFTEVKTFTNETADVDSKIWTNDNAIIFVPSSFTQSFEDVSATIRSNMEAQAESDAYRLARQSTIEELDYLNSLLSEMNFEEVAEKVIHAKAYTSDYFTADDFPPVEDPIQFREVAFKLTPDTKYSRISDTITTENQAMFLMLHSKKEPTIPAFAEIKDQVREDLISVRFEETYKNALESTRGQIIDAMDANAQSFEDAAKSIGLTVTSTPSFRPGGFSAGTDPNWGKLVFENIVTNYNVGEVTAPSIYRDEGYIGFIKNRIASKVPQTQEQKDAMYRDLQNQRAGIVLERFQAQITDNLDIELRDSVPADDSVEPETDADSASVEKTFPVLAATTLRQPKQLFAPKAVAPAPRPVATTPANTPAISSGSSSRANAITPTITQPKVTAPPGVTVNATTVPQTTPKAAVTPKLPPVTPPAVAPPAIKAPGIAAPGVTAPKANLAIPKPNIAVPKPNLAIPKPNIAVPKPNIAVPKPNIAVPKPNIAVPKPNITAPKPNIAVPKPNIAVPKPNIAVPKPNIAVPKPNITAPKPNIAVPKPNIAVPKPNIAAPKPNIAVPKPNIAVPKPNIAVPKPNITAPKPNIAVPKVGLPAVPSIKDPEMKIPTLPSPTAPSINVPKPSINVPSVPSINVPKPSINVPKPSINVPKPSINVPSVPSINVPKPSINVPKPSINVPSVPSAGIAVPAAGNTADAAGGLLNRVKSGAGQAVGGTGNLLEKAADATKDAAGNTVDAAGGLLNRVKSGAGQAVGGTGNLLEKAADATKDAAGNTADAAGGLLNRVKSGAGQAVGGTGNLLEKAADATKDAAGNAAEKASDLIPRVIPSGN